MNRYSEESDSFMPHDGEITSLENISLNTAVDPFANSYFAHQVSERIFDQLHAYQLNQPQIEKVMDWLHRPINVQEWLKELRCRLDEVESQLDSYPDKQLMLEYLRSGEHLGIDPDCTVTYLNLLISQTIAEKLPLRLLIFNDGSVLPDCPGVAIASQKLEETERKVLESHICISLPEIIQGLTAEAIQFYTDLSIPLSKEELQLLDAVKAGAYQSLTVRFKDRKMKSLELVQEQDAHKKLIDILKSSSYQNIVIKTHQGKISRIQNTVKILF